MLGIGLRFEAKEAKVVPPSVLTLNRLTEVFLERFQQVEDPSVLWQELNNLRQGQEQAVDEYVQVFTGLWDKWRRTLKQEVPPLFVKKS